ncbi:MAG TPA: tRNA (adenosine(37)-N6)-threonylcarbamoyltransferase complex dimerization subunit type 1 TsaB [Bacilli bacterium]
MNKKQRHDPPDLWLALDTSTPSMTIALFQKDRLLAESTSLSERNHSIRLVPAIRELLGSQGMTAADLRGICAGVGPGSYTGVRIGVTAAKTIAWTRSLPLVGVSSLETLAYGGLIADGGGSAQSGAWVIPMIDARRGYAYTAVYGYDCGEAGWHSLHKDGIRPLEQWLHELFGGAENIPGKVLFVGDTAAFLPILHQLAEKGLPIGISRQALSAEYGGAIALRKWIQGETEAPHHFNPNYTQLAEAEKKLLGVRK